MGAIGNQFRSITWNLNFCWRGTRVDSLKGSRKASRVEKQVHAIEASRPRERRKMSILKAPFLAFRNVLSAKRKQFLDWLVEVDDLDCQSFVQGRTFVKLAFMIVIQSERRLFTCQLRCSHSENQYYAQFPFARDKIYANVATDYPSISRLSL